MDRASIISVLEDTKRSSERCLEFLTEEDASYYTFKERSEALGMAIAALREQAVQPSKEGNREQEQSNDPLTLEELMVIDAPVWFVCKPIEGGDGYWCLCRKGHITTPAGSCYYVSEIPHWFFLRHKPKEGAE